MQSFLLVCSDLVACLAPSVGRFPLTSVGVGAAAKTAPGSTVMSCRNCVVPKISCPCSMTVSSHSSWSALTEVVLQLKRLVYCLKVSFDSYGGLQS